MLTRPEPLPYKALRGIDLAELFIIVAVITDYWLCRCNYGRAIGCEWGGLCWSGCRKKVDYCAVLAIYCTDPLVLY